MTSSSQDLMRGFHFFPVEYAHPMFLIDLFFCCAKYGKSKSKSRSKLINFWWFEIALASQKIASEIEEIREKLPKLGPLTKALKIHEIMITSGGQVRSKNLPSDVFYENVKLKESRRIRRVDQHDDDNV